ncbi:class I SAM-dependent methyltransferase [bacterium]|nr:class I SAM-dependent methyltransferase [bacterium]
MEKLNSLTWWNKYFSKKWESEGGRFQTKKHFEAIIENIPEGIRRGIEKNRLSIVDVGCALGDGVYELRRIFGENKIIGVDPSVEAIKKAKNAFPNDVFFAKKLEDCSERFDVVISSHCLEHFSYPKEIIRNYLSKTNVYFIMLVPFCEETLIDCHFHTFKESDFPDQVDDFGLVFKKILPPDLAWDRGTQVLAVYCNIKYEKYDSKLIYDCSLADDLARIINKQIRKNKELEWELNRVVSTKLWKARLFFAKIRRFVVRVIKKSFGMLG